MSSTVFAYPLDPTGQNPANRIEGELHVADVKRVRAIIPRYGPYFTATVRVFDHTTGVELNRNIQFRCAELLQDATLNYGQEICSLILIVDSTASTNIRIDYQVLGGLYTNNIAALANVYEAVVNDSRPVDWQNVQDKPVAYPPTMHSHVLSDVYGWEPIISALERVRSAIVLSNVPAFEALLDWVNERLTHVKISADSVGLGDVVNLPLATGDEVDLATPVKKYLTHEMFIRALTSMDIRPATKITPKDIGLADVANLPIVTLDEVKAITPSKKYLTHELFIEALKAMGLYGTVSTATYRLDYSYSKTAGIYTAKFIVTTTGVADGAVLYWTVTHLGVAPITFKAIGGSVGILGGYGEFYVEFTTDGSPTNTETFVAQLHTGSLLGPVVSTSDIVAIVDGIAPPPPIDIATVIAALQAETIYSPLVTIAANTYYWAGNLGRRIERPGSATSDTTSVTDVSIAKVIAAMTADSCYEAASLITANTYYWTGNVGKRIHLSGSAAGYSYDPSIADLADNCCLYDLGGKISAKAYYLVGQDAGRYY